MRQLIRTYNITGNHEITVTGYTFTKQDIRLIIDETLASAAITTEDLMASVLVSSTKKANVISVVSGVITLANTTAALTAGDELTIEIDIDNIAKESNATTNKQAILDALAAAKLAIQGDDATATLLALKTAIANLPTVAQIQNGLATSSALSSVAIDAGNAASDAAAAKMAAQAITGYALQGSDAAATNTAILQAIPSVAGLATESNATSNKNEVLSAIAANAGIPTLTIPDSTASQELAPNVLYIFATRTSTLTLILGTPIVGIANEYHFFVVCGSTAPTINFPAGITWNGGSAPTIAADKTYEVSILNNVAAYFEV